MADDVNVLQTDWWIVDIPDEWEAEQDEDSVVIGDADGVGVIEISTLLAEDGATIDVAELFAQFSTEPGHPVQLAGLRGLYASFADGEDHVRQWCVANGKLALIISYCCDRDDAGMDDSAVDAILDTLGIATTLLD